MQQGSYVSGTSSIPLIGETIGRHFDQAVARWGDREGLVVRHQDLHWTYRELAARVDGLAAGLLALGLVPGDRIGIWSPNNAEWVQTIFAAAKAGLILVNINPAYRLSELEHALKLSGCKAIISASRFKTSDYLGMLRDLAPELATAQPGVLQAARLPDLRIVIHLDPADQPGMLKFADLPGRGGAAERGTLADLAGRLQFDDPINIQFTSGTTGLPKGATLTHHNILNNGFFVAEAMGLREGDRLCIPVPLYHCFGMVMSVLACMSHGATMVFPCEGFDPLAVLQTIEAERCTLVHGVPTMFIAEMEHPDFATFDLSPLRAGIMAGSPCPIEVMRRVIDQMHLREVTIAYGMTETSPVSFQSATDDPIERRVSTVGRIHPHLEVKIVDGEGRIVPRGQPGEILTRGYSVMLGYWNDPERTAEAVDTAGWMHTGDLGVIDDEGYCNIVGRIKDLVIRGGENIYPREIEEFLFRHPQIEAAQVFGVPDDRFGEELCVWIKLRAGADLDADAVRAFCQGQIAHYKIPRYVYFVEEFPMTVTGKIQKFIMREQVMKQLNLAPKRSA
ncbi:MAG TPA: AMP-binding protein [Aliidongia sp.]|uniref:AMP-binding protein n=1 Tax=Aliidongia sp. TaxID=1914230 RepID=UPI002DDD04E5|nr:AMP-binding protein [Aliidongia sp.]HEV2678015.1 AMP-binding protein [Aliidongia sp.]